jgi:hypothetical protein
MSSPFGQQELGGVLSRPSKVAKWQRRSAGALRNGFRPKSAAMNPRSAAGGADLGKMKFEALEPRYLLSADLMPLNVDMSTEGSDLTVHLDSNSNTLQVINNQNSSIVASQDAGSTSAINITGSAGNDKLALDLGTTMLIAGGVHFDGGNGNDTVTIGSLPQAMSGLVTLAGGDGINTLQGPSTDTTWTIDGQNSGHVAGADFSGFQNLTGAANNKDTFVFTATGGLDGTVEGGAGGFDVVEVQGGTYNNLAFTYTGPQSGTIDRDGNTLTYAGMEPVVVNGGTATDIVYNLPNAAVKSEFTVSGTNFSLTSQDGPKAFEDTTVAVAGVTSVSLNLGTGDDTLSIHDITGTGAGYTTKIDGQAGNDTIKFGNGFGQVELTNKIGEGTDTIDFTNNTHALTVSQSGDTIDDLGDNSQLKQLTSNAEEINANLGTGAEAAIEGLFDSLQSLITSAESGANAIKELGNALPFIGGAANGIGDVAGLTDAFTQLATKAKAALNNGDTTLKDIVDALNGLSLSPPAGSPLTTLSLSASTSYRGAEADNLLEMLVDMHFQAAASKTYAFDIGQAGENLGISLTGSITGAASIDANLSIGISTDTPTPVVFLEPGGTINLGLDATANLAGTALNLGLLSLNLSTFNLELKGELDLAFKDNDFFSDGRITDFSNPADIITVTTAPNPSVTATASVTVGSGVTVGVLDLSSLGALTADIGIQLVGSPFGDSSHAAVPKITHFDVTINSQSVDLLGFTNVNTNDLLGMLGGVLDTLNAITNGAVMNTDIPFTSETLGNLLDFGTSFKQDVLDPLFKSGDFLNPDFNGDGNVTFADLNFSSIQSLVGKLAASLNIPVTAAFDPANNEVTFSIDYARAFGLGAGSVVTTTQGVLNTTAEVQKLTFDPTKVKSFRLAYRDHSTGTLVVTNSIDATLSDAALATAIDTAVEGLSNAFSTKVNVTGTTAAGYTITFDKTLGNLDQLGFAGEQSLNFGASLGDFASVSTTGSIGMAAALSTGLTFGIDLTPDQAVQIAPVNATPQNQGSVTVSLPNTNSFSTQTLVITATGGQFALGLDNPAVSGASQTDAINFDAGNSTIQSAINNKLSGQLGGSTVAVTGGLADANNVRTLTLTFSGGTGPGALLQGIAAPNGGNKLTGPYDTGKLTSAATFQFTLYDGAAQVVERDNQGNVVMVGGNPVSPATIAEREVGSATVTITNSDISNNISFADNGDNDPTNDLVNDVQFEVNKSLASNGLNFGFYDTGSGQLSTGAVAAGGNKTADYSAFTSFFGSDADFTVTKGSTVFGGSLRAVDVLDTDASGPGKGTLFDPGTGNLSTEVTANNIPLATIAAAMTNAVNRAIGTPGAVTIDVNGGKLRLTNNTSDSLTLTFASPITANAGGGRITLDTPQYKISTQALNTPVTADRRIEITVDSSNTAYTQLGIASVPTRFDGTISNSINLTLQVNGADVNVSLDKTVAAGNTSLDQLVTELQSAVDSALTSTNNPDAAPNTKFSAGDITVQRAALSDSSPVKGNRILFVGKEGVVHTLASNVPTSPTNGAITDLGLQAGQSEVKRSKAGTFFLQDVTFGGSLGLFENNLAAKASLGILGITADASALDGPGTSASTGKFFGADINFSLRDPIAGGTRITVDQIADAISAHKFMFDAADEGGTVQNPGTGFIDGVISGGLGVDLSLHPDGALSGLASNLAELKLSAADPNFLIALPGLTDTWGFGATNKAVSGGISLTTAVATTGQLSQDLVFVVGQTVNSVRYETLAIVRAEDTQGNTTTTQLNTQLQTAVNRALARLADMAGGPIGSTITSHIDGSGNVSFTGTGAVELRGNVINIDFDASGLQATLDELKHLSFDDIIGVLRQVVNMLQGLGSSGGPLSDVLGFKIPIIDRSVDDLLNMASDFTNFVNQLASDPSGSLQVIETKLDGLLGLPSATHILSFSSGVLYFNFDFDQSLHTTRPFDLNLGDLIGPPFSSLVGLDSSGNLGVDASFDLTLKLGLDLAGDDNHRGFFIDVNDTKLDAQAHFHGNNLSFSASLGPVGVFVQNGSAALDGEFKIQLADPNSNGRLYLLSFDGSGVSSDLGNLGAFLQAPTVTGTGSLSMPLFYGLSSSPVPLGSPNTLSINIDLKKLISGDTANGLVVKLPTFDFSNLKLPGLFDLLSDPSVIVKGLDQVFEQLQDLLQGELLGVKLPLLGDALANNPVSHFIENFRLQFLQPLAKMLAESNVNLDGLINLVTSTITNVFENIADSQVAGGVANLLMGAVKAEFVYADGSVHVVGQGTIDLNQAQSLQFEFDLGQLKTITLASLNFDLGIPGFGLTGSITPTLDFAWHLHVGFGVNLKQGFYFLTNYDDPSDGPGQDPELSVALNLNLGSTDASRAQINGSLLFLGLHLQDGLDLNKSGTIDSLDPNNPSVNDEFTDLYLKATVDLKDYSGGPNNTSDGHLTLPELISQSPLDTFVFDVQGGANLRAQATVDFSGFDTGSSGGLSLSHILPSISMGVMVDFSIGFSPASGLTVDPPEIALTDISLNLGSFINGFAGDVLKTIKDVLDPLAWLIGPDGLLNMRIPLISDLLGQTIRMRDLISFFDPDDGPKVNAFLDFVQELYFLTDLVKDAGSDAFVLNFGDFILYQKPGGNSFFDQLKKAGDFFQHDVASLSLPSSANGDLRNLQSLANQVVDGVQNGIPSTAGAGSSSQRFTAGVTKPGSVEFDILKPDTIFALLLGKPATLVTVQLPELGFSFEYRQVIPIIGPLAATFSGSITGALDLGFGYDTLGLQQFLATKNPAYLLNGFFLNDLDPVTKADRPEATFSASIAVGAALSLGVATVGVEGGITANIFFNLNDPDHDGKVRFEELASNILANGGDPLAMFDISGDIEFFLRAYIQVLFFEASFEFVRLKLFSFEIPFNRPGVLASQSGDTLTLNIGPNAAGRMQGDTTDGNEEIHAETLGDGTVAVWSDQFFVTKAIAETNPFTGVHKIIVDGGNGNDIIDMSGVKASDGVTVVAHGGPGDDTITGGGGDDQLFGDDGNDIIHGGGGNDTIHGGSGDDQLFGDDGNDQLFGDAGNDTLNGGAGNDTLSGGPGNDTIIGSADDDTFNLADAGSIDFADASGGSPILDLSGKNVPITVFIKDDRVLIGFGKQKTDSTTILGTTFTFTDQATLETEFGDAFDSVVGVADAHALTKIIGTSEADTFYTVDNQSHLVLDGGSANDTYVFYADPTHTHAIDVQVDDNGEHLKDENTIQIQGADTADHITVTSDTIKLDDTAGQDQTVTYVPPSSDPSQFNDQLEIKVFGNGGDDTLAVQSTFVTVPVRLEGGAGDDTFLIGGGPHGLNDLDSFLNANANKGFGLGPLTIVGGDGTDTVIVDDSADTSDNTGNITAFTEKREGVTNPVEVGVVAGLGMDMSIPDGNGGINHIDGHIEYEGTEVVDLLLGSGNDKLTVGGGFNLDANSVNGGVWTTDTGVTAEVPKTRLSDPNGNPAQPFGVQSIVNSITGMTVIHGGGGNDTLDVIATNTTSRSDVKFDGMFNVQEQQAGDASHDEIQTVTINTSVGAFDAGAGAFTLTFDDGVNGPRQTGAIQFGASATDVQAALVDLVTIGRSSDPPPVGNKSDNVHVTKVGNTYTIEFVKGLKNRAFSLIQAQFTPLLIDGDAGADQIDLGSIAEPTWIKGGSGDDMINVSVQLPVIGVPERSTTNAVNSYLNLDGEDGSDTYNIFFFGGLTHSLMDVHDTGTGATDSDVMNVEGTDNPDIFLLRAAADNSGLAFIAGINLAANVERVNYDLTMETINLYGNDGADQFYIDDTRAAINIYGGDALGHDDTFGSDNHNFFQIGQLYQTDRGNPTGLTAGIGLPDLFVTIETTKGWLSNGISVPMTIHGGDAGDTFVVFHNIAELGLDGGAGDDTFIIQAFALQGSQDDNRGKTDVSGGAGNDLIQYAVNAPVDIDGGGGFNTVIVIGTEFNDDFVVTADGVFGAGLFVDFRNIQALEVDGAEGDDRFFVQGTSPNFTTTIVGGLGSDLFDINGPTPANGVIANSLLGHSGLISNLTTASDPNSAYNGLKTDGISANVADNDEPGVVITPSFGELVAVGGKFDSVMQVTEGSSAYVTYSVVLTHDPGAGNEVHVNSSVPDGLVFLDPVTLIKELTAQGAPKDNTVIFNSSNWYIPQLVAVAASDLVVTNGVATQDTIANGQRFASIKNTVHVYNTAETITHDNDTIVGSLGSVLQATDNTLTANAAIFPVAGGDLPQGLLGAQVTITGGPGTGQVRYISSNTGDTITVDRPWTVNPTSDSSFTILRYEAVKVHSVDVRINDNDSAGVIINESDGSTKVREIDTANPTLAGLSAAQLLNDGFTDTFDVSLSKAPTADVTVNLASSANPDGYPGVLTFFNSLGAQITSLTFHAGDTSAQTVTVKIVADGKIEGPYHERVLLSTSSLGDSSYNSAANPTNLALQPGFDTDIADNESPQVVVVESAGSTNVIEGGDVSAASVINASPYIDTYSLVLSQAPALGQSVKVLLSADPTRTTRADVIVTYQPQVTLFGSGIDGATGLPYVVFDSTNWYKPQTVTVQAIDDQVVDGGDTKVFATQLDLASNIEGPLNIQGGPGPDHSELTSREPQLLPGETNFPPPLHPNPGIVSQASDITDAFGVTTGTVTITAAQALEAVGLTDSLGDLIGLPLGTDQSNLAQNIVGMSVQMSDGVGKNKVRFVTSVLSESDPGQLDDMLTLSLNKPWQTVSTETDPAAAAVFTNTDIPDQASADVSRFQAGGSGKNEIDLVSVTATGGHYELTLDGKTTGPIVWNATDAQMKSALAGLGIAGLDAAHIDVIKTIPGFNGTPPGDEQIYTITFKDVAAQAHTLTSLTPDIGTFLDGGGTPSAVLSTTQNGVLNVKPEVQNLQINGNGGTFTVTVNSQTTSALAYNISATDLQTQLGLLSTVGNGNVAVSGNAGGPYTITYVSSLGNITASANGTNLVRNEVQVLTVQQTAGVYALTIPSGPHAGTTTDINFNADAGTIQAALQALPGLSSKVTVVETLAPGLSQVIPGVTRQEVYTITFQTGVNEPALVAKIKSGPSAYQVYDLVDAGQYILRQTNPNLLVDEATQVDTLNLSNADDPADTTGMITGSRITGLGMGGDVMIGPNLQLGGISFSNLEEVGINLGNGNNHFVIDTNNGGFTGQLIVNGGAGVDTIDVLSLGGHTYINTKGGNDTVNVSDQVKTLQSMQGLLTVSGDVPQAVVTPLAHGSPAGISEGQSTTGTQQLLIEATGGDFKLGFKGQNTVALASNVVGGPTAELFVSQQGDALNPQIETLKVNADGGSYKLVLDIGTGPETTDVIPYNATAGQLQALIAAQTGFSGKVGVTGGAGAYTLTFDKSLGNLGVLVDSSGLALSGTMQAALAALSTIGTGNVRVLQFGNIYRINFTGTLSDEIQPRLQIVDDNLTGASIKAVNTVQQLVVDATGGTFSLSFNGGPNTPDLQHDVSGTALQTALENLSGIGVGNVQVVQSGSTYRITFVNALAGADQPLLQVHDRGLTNGLGSNDTLNVDDSGFPQSIATINGPATVGDTLMITVGAFGSFSYTAQNNDSPATLTAGLLAAAQANAALKAAGFTFQTQDNVLRIHGPSNFTTAQLSASVSGAHSESIAFATLSPQEQAVLTSSSLTITSMNPAIPDWSQPNEIQEVHLDATGGTFTLTFRGDTTGPLAWNISAADMQAALEQMSSFGKGQVAVTRNDDVYVLTFQGTLTDTDVPQVTADASQLTLVREAADGTPTNFTATASVFTRVNGQINPPINDVQAVTINATGGTFTLSLAGRGSATAALNYDASAEEVRAALQLALEGGNLGKTDLEVQRYGNVYLIGFEGQLRDVSGGSPIPLLTANTSGLTGTPASLAPVTIATRMNGINYYGLETLNINLGASAGSVLNVQGTSPGSTATATSRSVTNVVFGSGDNQVFISSNADLDQNTQPGFDFLTGDMNSMYGSLNVDFGTGRHRLMISNEAATAGDPNIQITDHTTATTNALQLNASYELFITGMSQGGTPLTQGGIAIKTGLTGGNFRDGVQIWTGSGNDNVYIDGTENRGSDPSDRTVTMLNTGLGNDNVTTNLQAGAALQVTTEGFTGLTSQVESLAINATGGTFTLTFDGLTTTAQQWNVTAASLQTAIRALAGMGATTVTGLGTTANPFIITFANSLGSLSSSVDWSNLIGTDGFFVLNTAGGASAPAPGATTWTMPAGKTDDDTVDASQSTLPLIIFGGPGYDNIKGGQGSDVILGDFGRMQTVDKNGNIVATYGYGGRGDLISSLPIAAQYIYSTVPGPNVLSPSPATPAVGGNDIIQGNGGDDILIGGAGNDIIDGGANNDLIFGDDVQLKNNSSFNQAGAQVFTITNPRFETLAGTAIYTDSTFSDMVNVDGTPRAFRTQGGAYLPGWASWNVQYLDQNLGTDASRAGNDYIAGGADDDEIFGQGGNDVIMGDGSVLTALTGNTFTGGAPVSVQIFAPGNVPLGTVTAQAGTSPVYAFRGPSIQLLVAPGQTTTALGALYVQASTEAASDGNDYIEGGAGNDTVFGGLGQDDIVGGSSDMFSLTTSARRQDGSNMIFGGSGTEAGYDAAGNPVSTATNNVHSRDADNIAVNNADIYDLVGTNHTLLTPAQGNFLTYNYDKQGAAYDATYGGLDSIIPRAVKLLDYTYGGLDFNPLSAVNDIGSGSEVHGESGDDVIYGGAGRDTLFGDGQNDQIIGGWNADWIDGGAGNDGILGDDGRLQLSRNGIAEPLNGINTASVQSNISTPGNIQQATIYTTGLLNYAADETPFNLDPVGRTSGALAQSVVFRPTYADDIIYGGLGDDSIHGGAGDDAISGAEALPFFWSNPVADPTNILLYQSGPQTFAAYDEFNPMVLIGGTLNGFFLNFDPAHGPQAPDFAQYGDNTDGNDIIFGDYGNDWLVGGTGQDHMYGGFGDDLLNADDNQNTDGGKNDQPDTAFYYQDIAFGGAGRDTMIANTGGDRLIDWHGEFNAYLVPFAPFGQATVSRDVNPQLQQYLYTLGAADGADNTFGDGPGTDATRNGEPYGELGLVTHVDPFWHDQTGAPNQPQAGNTPGGHRDVLRSADFTNGALGPVLPVSGTFAVTNGALVATPPTTLTNSFAVFDVNNDLPNYYEVTASLQVGKPTGGYKSNAYIIFDYVSATDFKFAGLDGSTNKVEVGHFNGTSWVIDAQTSVQGGVSANTVYGAFLQINGNVATITINNTWTASYTYPWRVIQGQNNGLNYGIVGVGANASTSSFDNIVVQVPTPPTSFTYTENFTGGSALYFDPAKSGSWVTTTGSDLGTASTAKNAPNGGAALQMIDIGLSQGMAPGTFVLDSTAMLDLKATLSMTAGSRAGLVYASYSTGSYKFAALYQDTQQVVLGHYTPKGGFVIDASANYTVVAGTKYTLELISSGGNAVTLTVNGNNALSYTYNSVVTSGQFGLATLKGSATFSQAYVRTDDYRLLPAVVVQHMDAATGPTGPATGVTELTSDDVNKVLNAAIDRLSAALSLGASSIATLRAATIQIEDLPVLELGLTVGSSITLSSNAAGWGWFVDSTPYDDSEFRQPTADGMVAPAGSPASGSMDLLTVVMHELAHLLGYSDTASGSGLMSATLNSATRLAPPVAAPGQQRFGLIEGIAGPQVANVSVFDPTLGVYLSQDEARGLLALSSSGDDDSSTPLNGQKKAPGKSVDWSQSFRSNSLGGGSGFALRR